MRASLKWRCFQSNCRLASPVESAAQQFLGLGQAPTGPATDEFQLVHATGPCALLIMRGLLLQLGTSGLYGILIDDLENIF